jgi:hypothetical protein
MKTQKLRTKTKGYHLINGKKVLNTDEIPFHKGGRPKVNKSMTYEGGDRKLHPIRTMGYNS